jgi:hypothetical protein
MCLNSIVCIRLLSNLALPGGVSRTVLIAERSDVEVVLVDVTLVRLVVGRYGIQFRKIRHGVRLVVGNHARRIIEMLEPPLDHEVMRCDLMK